MTFSNSNISFKTVKKEFYYCFQLGNFTCNSWTIHSRFPETDSGIVPFASVSNIR